MLFTMFCIDKPGVTERRAEVMPAHVEYLSTEPVKLVMSGPLTSDDGENIVGSLYVFEADDRAAVDAFQANDPLVQADIWETVETRAFNKRVDNRG
ncbi:MAG: YciI family protein [Alphaproteobacteria bacterium]|nr:YciI family protein [Alphaproteobacteria bacterium]